MKTIFKEAARIIAEDELYYSCMALAAASDPTYIGQGCYMNPAVNLYQDLMEDPPENKSWDPCLQMQIIHADGVDRRHLRTMLLLMAGEVLGDEQ